jgi:DNA replication licensing factor MCM5
MDQQVLKLQEMPESVPTGEMPRSLDLVLDRYGTRQQTKETKETKGDQRRPKGDQKETKGEQRRLEETAANSI